MKCGVLLLLTIVPTALHAQDHAEKAAHSHEVLGTVNFANSGNARAQPALQRGVALLHNFEYEAAAESFRAAQRADAALAIAYWLEALTYSHVVWSEERLDKARAALARLAPSLDARLAKAKTGRERSFGAAIEAFFADAPLPQRASAFADSMERTAAAYPEDQEAGAFAALASMFAFFSGSAEQRAKYNTQVRQHALRVFEQNKQHPGATHYLIHFTDMNPSAARDALPFARAYDKIAPDASHALHMPSHVYLPLGLWQDVVTANERSWAASRREVISKKTSPTYNDWHSLQWLQYSYLQLGRDADARALVDTAYALLKGVQIEDENPDARNVVAQLAFWYGAETGKWDAYPSGLPSVDVELAQPRPNARARGMAVSAAYQAAVAHLLARNDAAPAQKVIDRFRSEAAQLPAESREAVTQLRLAGQLEALTARARGDRERAIELLREAARTEPTSASTPAITIPTYELLGETLLEAGRKSEAIEAFERALEARANRRAALRGLERAKSAMPTTDQQIEAAVLPLPEALFRPGQRQRHDVHGGPA